MPRLSIASRRSRAAPRGAAVPDRCGRPPLSVADGRRSRARCAIRINISRCGSRPRRTSRRDSPLRRRELAGCGDGFHRATAARPLSWRPAWTCKALGEVLARLQATPTFPAFVRYPDIVARLWAHVCRTGLFAPGVLDRCNDHLEEIRAAGMSGMRRTRSPATTTRSRPTSCSTAPGALDDRPGSAYRTDPLVDLAIVGDSLARTPELQTILHRAWRRPTAGRCAGRSAQIGPRPHPAPLFRRAIQRIRDRLALHARYEPRGADACRTRSRQPHRPVQDRRHRPASTCSARCFSRPSSPEQRRRASIFRCERHRALAARALAAVGARSTGLASCPARRARRPRSHRRRGAAPGMAGRTCPILRREVGLPGNPEFVRHGEWAHVAVIDPHAARHPGDHQRAAVDQFGKACSPRQDGVMIDRQRRHHRRHVDLRHSRRVVLTEIAPSTIRQVPPSAAGSHSARPIGKVPRGRDAEGPALISPPTSSAGTAQQQRRDLLGTCRRFIVA